MLICTASRHFLFLKKKKIRYFCSFSLAVFKFFLTVDHKHFYVLVWQLFNCFPIVLIFTVYVSICYAISSTIINSFVISAHNFFRKCIKSKTVKSKDLKTFTLFINMPKATQKNWTNLNSLQNSLGWYLPSLLTLYLLVLEKGQLYEWK